MPNKRIPSPPWDRHVDQFADDAVGWISDRGLWGEFLKEMKSRGFSEAEVDELTAKLSKRAGRVG